MNRLSGRVHLRDCLPKENALAQVDSAGDRLPVPRTVISDKKFLCIVASNYSMSHFYYEILYDGGSVNAERYIEFRTHGGVFSTMPIRIIIAA